MVIHPPFDDAIFDAVVFDTLEMSSYRSRRTIKSGRVRKWFIEYDYKRGR